MIQTGTGMGMQSMDQALMKYVQDGKITAMAAYEKAIDKEIFAKLIRETGAEVPVE